MIEEKFRKGPADCWPSKDLKLCISIRYSFQLLEDMGLYTKLLLRLLLNLGAL